MASIFLINAMLASLEGTIEQSAATLEFIITALERTRQSPRPPNMLPTFPAPHYPPHK
jgi:uncharacterized coiled-coil protein SlyX